MMQRKINHMKTVYRFFIVTIISFLIAPSLWCADHCNSNAPLQPMSPMRRKYDSAKIRPSLESLVMTPSDDADTQIRHQTTLLAKTFQEYKQAATPEEANALRIQIYRLAPPPQTPFPMPPALQ